MKKSIKRTVSVFVLVVMILSLLPVVSFAADGDTPYTDFTYTVSGSTVTLGKYKGTATAVVVPGSYVVNGVTCTTVIDSKTTFTGNTKIKSVTLNSGVKFNDNIMSDLFWNCTALTTVNLSEISTANITKMTNMFRECKALTAFNGSNFNTSKVESFSFMFQNASNLVLSGYENWNTSSLTAMRAMFDGALRNSGQTLDLSNWNLSKVTNTHTAFQYCNAADLILPSTLTRIDSYCLSHLIRFNKSSFTIPKGVKEIGYAHVIYDFGYSNGANAFKEISVEEGNTNFKAVDGVLYSMDGTKFIAMPRGKTHTNNTYEILEGVTFLPELSFSRTPHISTLILPNSYVIRQYVPKNDPEYFLPNQSESLDANLNHGNSLSIAVYTQTSIANYQVKADNPRYKSDRGIIYSKDMTKLIAVPLKYNQTMIIPEGVKRWENDAMYCDACTSKPSYANSNITVKIPASMTYIADNQISTLHYLKNNVGWKIEVDENNPVYKLDNGYIVQYGISDGLVSLSATSYASDGTAKKPTVTVQAAKGTTSVSTSNLTQGTHYDVEYIDNVKEGVAKVKITGKSYPGIVYKTFVIEDSEATFEAYDRDEETASTSLPKPAGTNFIKIGEVADKTWKAASTGFGSNNSAHAGIVQKERGETDASNNVLAVEAVGSTSNWNNKSRVIYEDITFDNDDKYTVKVDFYRGASGAGGGLIFNYDGDDSSSLSNSNYYAIDFVGKANSYGANNVGDVYATALVKNGNWVSDATISTNYSGSDFDSDSRKGHDYVASTTWHTLTLTYNKGTIEWSVYRINADTVIQTGSWKDPNPSTSGTVRIALYSGGADNSYMHFDNFYVGLDPLQVPKYTATATNSDIRVEFHPETVDDIENIEKLQLIVAYYDKETDAFLRMEKKVVRDFSNYLAESFKPAAGDEYARVFIWRGDFSDITPAHSHMKVGL